MNNDTFMCVNARAIELNAAIHHEEEDTYIMQKLVAWAFCAYTISILIVEVNNTPSISFSQLAKKIVEYNPSYIQLQVICLVAVLCGMALFGALHFASRLEEKHVDLILKQNKEIQMLKARIGELSQNSVYLTHKPMVSSMDTSNTHYTTIWKKTD